MKQWRAIGQWWTGNWYDGEWGSYAKAMKDAAQFKRNPATKVVQLQQETIRRVTKTLMRRKRYGEK